MMISSRGRYALRVMVELAGREGLTPLKDIAAKEELSQKYLESIMTLLSKAGLVEGSHGRGGGYRLSRPPEEYTMEEILSLAEGGISAVGCQAESGCQRADCCPTRPLWARLDELVSGFLSSVTLADLL
ncbi:MAG: Rrf2 family transcriptional regulator, partial [Oscillospiraceae bacterium]|nr:Rrf2 family transcriptional regulator [Oscillospiraceae bacterium]